MYLLPPNPEDTVSENVLAGQMSIACVNNENCEVKSVEVRHYCLQMCGVCSV